VIGPLAEMACPGHRGLPAVGDDAVQPNGGRDELPQRVERVDEPARSEADGLFGEGMDGWLDSSVSR
jgi:hypothetical protein